MAIHGRPHLRILHAGSLIVQRVDNHCLSVRIREANGGRLLGPSRGLQSIEREHIQTWRKGDVFCKVCHQLGHLQGNWARTLSNSNFPWGSWKHEILNQFEQFEDQTKQTKATENLARTKTPRPGSCPICQPYPRPVLG